MHEDHIFTNMHNTPMIARELCDALVGEIIGTGQNRQVYDMPMNPFLVIKHEYCGNRFQNAIEWEVWQTVKNTKYEKWFAPCQNISSNGVFLLQSKVEMIPKAHYPKKIPSFFADLKYENYGILNGKFVCFDYGTIHITSLNKSMKSTKMIEAKWKNIK